MAIHLLSEDQAMTRIDGRYDDGGGLWLIVRNHGHAASYFFEYNGELVGEKGWQHVSLGARKKTSLSQARERGALCRDLIKKGISPQYWREHERKEKRKQDAASLTVAEAVEGRDDPQFEGFRKWGVGRVWHKNTTTDNKRWLIDTYFKPSIIWNMRVQEVEPAHAAKLLDPYWFPKRATGKRIQSFGKSLFKWLKLNKLYFEENPFDGSIESPMVDLLGGPQPPSNRRDNCEPNDLPLIMAHLRTPPTHGDDVCTVAEAAEATERNYQSIRIAVRRGLFPGAYKWADWGTATHLIPVKELVKVFPLKRPLRKHIEVSIEALALQYVIATGVRSGMGPELKWSFVKPKLGLIVYPPETHKEGEQLNDEYNIVLTPFVEEILEAARAYQEKHGIKSEYVFMKGPTRTGIDAFSDEPVKRAGLWRTFKTLLARIPEIERPEATLHDVRAALTEWACDRNDWPVTVVDVALGHAIKGIRNRTYFRNVRYRRQIQELMIDWQKFLLQVEPASVGAIPWRSQSLPVSQEGKHLRPWQPYIVRK